MARSMFVDDTRAISDCNHSLLKSIARGHVKVNLASLSKSDLGLLFVNVAPGLPQIQRLSLNISTSSAGAGARRKSLKDQNEPECSLVQYPELMKGLSTRIAGPKMEAILKQFFLSLSTTASSLMTLIFSLPLPPALFHVLSQSVARLPSLLHLSLHGSQAGDAGVQELCTLLQQGSCSVTHLDLSGCGLTDCSATCVAALLKTGTLKFCMERFKHFLREYPDSSLAPRIRDMLFQKRTAAIDAELRSSCPGLVMIALDCNQVTDDGALALFEAAMASSTIESIGLRANQLTMRAGRAAREAMMEHETLRAVDMRQNQPLKLGLLRDDHVKALKIAKSVVCGLAPGTPVKEEGSPPGKPDKTKVTILATASQPGTCSDDGTSIRPFRPTDLPTVSSEQVPDHVLDSQTPRRQVNDATEDQEPVHRIESTDMLAFSQFDDASDHDNSPTMETVLDVLEELYAEEEPMERSQGAMCLRESLNSLKSSLSSTPEHWSERYEPWSEVRGSGPGAAVVESTIGTQADPVRHVPAVRSNGPDSLNPDAPPFIGQRGQVLSPKRVRGHAVTVPEWRCGGLSKTEMRWWCGRFCVKASGRADGHSASASPATPQRERDIMSLSSWKKQGRPGAVGSGWGSGSPRTPSPCKHHNFGAGRGLSPVCMQAPSPSAVTKRKKKSRSKKRKSAVTVVRPPASGSTAEMAAKAAAASASAKMKGFGKADLRLCIPARAASVSRGCSMQQTPKIVSRSCSVKETLASGSRACSTQETPKSGMRGCSAPETPKRAQSSMDRSLSQCPAKFGPLLQKAVAAAQAEGTAEALPKAPGGLMKPPTSRKSLQNLMRSQSEQMTRNTCVVTRQHGPETTVKDFCAQVDWADSDPDATRKVTSLAPSLKTSVARGFVSMDDVCTWERRRQREHAKCGASSASGASTACDWVPEGSDSRSPGPASDEQGERECSYTVRPSASVGTYPTTREGEELKDLGGGCREVEAVQDVGGGSCAADDGAHGGDRPHAPPVPPVTSDPGKTDDQMHSWTPWGAVQAVARPEAPLRRSSTAAETRAAVPRPELLESPRKARRSRSDFGAVGGERTAVARGVALAQRAALIAAERVSAWQHACSKEGCDASGEQSVDAREGSNACTAGRCNAPREQDSEGREDGDGMNIAVPPEDLARFADAEETDE